MRRVASPQRDFVADLRHPSAVLTQKIGARTIDCVIMPTYSRHPVGAPPQAPPRESTRRLMLRAHAIFVLFTLFALPFWNHLLGTTGAAGVVILMTLGTLGWWIPLLVVQQKTNPFPWRRLPWTALLYVLWATLSISWSAWPASSALTVAGMLSVTLHALFLVHVLSWRELMRVIASALKWVVGLSLMFELFVSLVIQHPIFPFFVEPPAGKIDPQWYWSRDNLFDGGRIQGILGNANLLAILCLIAVIVFTIRALSSAPRRSWLIAWIVVSAYLMYRAGSATVFMCAAGIVAVLVCVLIMRRTTKPSQRSLAYFVFAGVGSAAALLVFVYRDVVFGLLGRSDNLTGRADIWAAIAERIAERPVIGWGYSSPWVPFDETISAGLVDHGQIVMQAHNMWIDVIYQLGWIGCAILMATMLALIWRSWFFAVDRPRWDLNDARPFTVISIFPVLMVALLLVQGITESAPIMLWGWLFIVMLSFKIKSAPIVGVGTAEQSAALEQGDAPPVRRPLTRR